VPSLEHEGTYFPGSFLNNPRVYLPVSLNGGFPGYKPAGMVSVVMNVFRKVISVS